MLYKILQKQFIMFPTVQCVSACICVCMCVSVYLCVCVDGWMVHRALQSFSSSIVKLSVGCLLRL